MGKPNLRSDSSFRTRVPLGGGSMGVTLGTERSAIPKIQLSVHETNAARGSSGLLSCQAPNSGRVCRGPIC